MLRSYDVRRQRIDGIDEPAMREGEVVKHREKDYRTMNPDGNDASRGITGDPRTRGTIRIAGIGILVGALALLAGCVGLESVVQPVPPNVSVQSVELTALSLAGADLVATIAVENPNPIGIALEGFAYQVLTGDNTVVSGRQTSGVDIAAQDTRTFEVPVTLVFADLIAAVRSLEGANETPYTLVGAVDVEIPLLGTRTIEITHDGVIPIPRLPDARPVAITLDSIGLAGADLSVTLEFFNPNVFPVTFTETDYRLVVEGTEWADGGIAGPTTLTAEGSSTVVIPVTLRFIEVGRGVYRILTGDDTVDFAFSLQTGIVPDHPLLPQFPLPLERSGEISLTR
jgi:LEA14-like dessication related protein